MTSTLETLRNRRQRLIEANISFGYVRTEKAIKYISLMKKINMEIAQVEAANREANKSSAVSLFLNASKGKSGFQILMAAR